MRAALLATGALSFTGFTSSGVAAGDLIFASAREPQC